MLRQVVAPVLAAYLLCVALVLLAARNPAGRPDHRPAALTRDRLTALIRYVALLEIGSYGTLLVIVGESALPYAVEQLLAHARPPDTPHLRLSIHHMEEGDLIHVGSLIGYPDSHLVRLFP